MSSKISGTPSARTFTEATKVELLRPAVEKLAGADGLLSANEAKQAGKLQGSDALVADAIKDFAKTLGTRPMSVEAVVDGLTERTLAEVRGAAGADGRLSKADARKMPNNLQLAYHFLKTGELPGPNVRFSEGILAKVMEEYGLTDQNALLQEALAFDDGNLYLKRTELVAAAEAMKTSLPAVLSAMPAAWAHAIKDKVDPAGLEKLAAFMTEERANETVFPPPNEVFTALERTSLQNVKVVLLGQDPYHGPGEAHGLSFSVKEGIKTPPSLANMYKELQSDLGHDIPNHGNLEDWADRGVLMLNAALTVRKDEPASHRGEGWEDITQAILEEINQKDERVVFLLLGADAQKQASLIDTSKHTIVRAAHPSPLSARRGFFGTKPFSAINDALEDGGRDPIDWAISDR